jgi:hypothetical protein
MRQQVLIWQYKQPYSCKSLSIVGRFVQARILSFRDRGNSTAMQVTFVVPGGDDGA